MDVDVGVDCGTMGGQLVVAGGDELDAPCHLTIAPSGLGGATAGIPFELAGSSMLVGGAETDPSYRPPRRNLDEVGKNRSSREHSCR